MLHHYKQIIPVLIVSLFFATSGFSSTTVLEEINVRAEKQAPTEESLTIREVKESSARDLGEALEVLPGLESVNKGAIANDIVLRGMQGDDINVFLDGVRLYGGCPSRMDPPSFHFDFAEVEQIQVLKGPYDLQNPGSMGGMVNAVSKQPPLGSSANLSATYGSDELVNAAATASIASKRGDILGGYAYKSSLSPRSGDGKRQIEIYPAGSNRSYLDISANAYNIDTAWIKTGYNLQTDVRSELGYSYQNADHVLYPYLFMDADYDRTNRVNWTLKADKLDAAVDALEFQLYWNQVEHLMHDKYRVSSTPSPMVTKNYSMLTDSETTVYGAKVTGDWLLGAGTLVTGVDYYYRNWDAMNESAMYNAYEQQPMLPDVDVNNFGGFAEYSQPFADVFDIKGGMRIDYTTTEATKLDSARLATYYQPYQPGATLENKSDFTSISGNVQLDWEAMTWLEFFSGVGLGTRSPDPQELYIGLIRNSSPMNPSNWVGNPDLKSSTNRQVDFGAKMTGESYFINLSVYYSSVDDYITLTSVADPDGIGTLIKAKTYQNVDATLWGGEVSSQLAMPMDLYLRGTLAYVRGENEESNQPLAEMPPLSGSASVRWDNDSYFVEITERFADAQDRVDPVLNEEPTPGWAVTDIKGGANWNNWSLAGGINNVFDLYYVTHLSYQRDPFSSGVKVPETGAFAYLTLGYKF